MTVLPAGTPVTGVKVTCVIGVSTPTPLTLHYDIAAFTPHQAAPAPVVGMGDGDGTVNRCRVAPEPVVCCLAQISKNSTFFLFVWTHSLFQPPKHVCRPAPSSHKSVVRASADVCSHWPGAKVVYLEKVSHMHLIASSTRLLLEAVGAV
jgi:hypothetical protein